MKTYHTSFVLFVAVLLTTASSVVAQTEFFSDPGVEYTFELPDSKWKKTPRSTATGPNVEYVFGDRYFGHLEVRKLSVTKDDILTEIVRLEERKLLFRPGFVAGKEENFLGRLKGAIYNFEYVAAGRSMSGRFYFLRANETIVYLLRFTGEKDSLRSIRHQTDSIARTFAIKQEVTPKPQSAIQK